MLDEDFFWLKISELSLKKTWDNKFDERWDGSALKSECRILGLNI